MRQITLAGGLWRHLFIAPLVAAALLAVACGGEKVDPVQAALSAYEPIIEPVLHEQEGISKLFVTITLDKVEPAGAIDRIKTQAIPKSQQLLDQVQGIQVSEPTVQGIHQQLVEASTLRLEGYKLMVKGFEEKSLDTFNQGRQKLTDSKIREENYVTQLDRLSKQYGIKIDFFPPVIGANP